MPERTRSQIMREQEVVAKTLALKDANAMGLDGRDAETFVERSWRERLECASLIIDVLDTTRLRRAMFEGGALAYLVAESEALSRDAVEGRDRAAASESTMRLAS